MVASIVAVIDAVQNVYWYEHWEPVVTEDLWNSLEWVKLIVAVLTPLAVALLGVAVARASKRAEDSAAEAARAAEETRWANRRVVERLIELHKEMAPLLNDLLCFFSLIGHFRSINPPGVLERKRTLDRLFFTNEQLFSATFRAKYQTFMAECFAHWVTPGKDALIKASPSLQRIERGDSSLWREEWDDLFEDSDNSQQRKDTQRRSYEDVMNVFAIEVGIRSPTDHSAGL